MTVAGYKQATLSALRVGIVLSAALLAGCDEEQMETMADSAMDCYRTIQPDDLSCVEDFHHDVVVPATEPFAEGMVTLIENMDPTQQ